MNNSNASLEIPSEKHDEKTCFIIMPIADMEGYDSGHFARVYNHIIKPACDNSGFKVIRADDVSSSNFIVLDILRKIIECDLAICDLSGRNPNVMYELGLRQAFNKKTVLIKDDRTVSPFDVQAFRYCEYDSLLRIDNAQKNVIKLSQAITSTYQHNENDVNSIVQLLKIQPALVGEKTVLSQENTLILQAIRELGDKFHTQSNSIEKVTKRKQIKHTKDGEDLKTQLDSYKIEQLIGNYYTKNGKTYGILDGVVNGSDGKIYYSFRDGSNGYLIEPNSSELAYLIDDGIPF